MNHGETATGHGGAGNARRLFSGLAALIAALALPVGGASAQDAPPVPAGSSGWEGETIGEEPAQLTGVKVSEYMTVDIFVQDEDLANVLQMLSLQSQRNIVASRDVVATVTANLYDVTFYEALDSILHVNGFGYIEQGNFIYVYPAEVIQAIERERMKKISKVIQLNYLNANDAAEFVSPLLSESGEIKTNGDPGEWTLTQATPTGAEDFALASTLVIIDFEQQVEEIERLLDQLDTRPSQVLVESTILQTQLTEANAFGIDFAIIADVDFTDFADLAGPLGSALSLANTDGQNETGFAPADNNGTAIVSNPGNFEGPATLKAAVLVDDFAVFLRALDEVTDTTVLSSPKVLALNRQPARVLVGRKIGYLNTTSTQTATTQTVEFLDTGTQLSFRPFISKDGMIRLELAPRVSEGFIRSSTDIFGTAVTIPDEVTQEVTTNVLVPDGATVVLGGLFREQTSLGRSQVPVLGDIPLIGAAFRGHDDSTDRTEIIFMIRPTIMNDQILLEQGERGMAYAERVRTGARQGLLPFSRDRQTSQLNVQAERAARDGDMNKAMWHLRRSLELNPMQPDALELRERIFGDKDLLPSRSLLDRSINGEIEAIEAGPWSENETAVPTGAPATGTAALPYRGVPSSANGIRVPSDDSYPTFADGREFAPSNDADARVAGVTDEGFEFIDTFFDENNPGAGAKTDFWTAALTGRYWQSLIEDAPIGEFTAETPGFVTERIDPEPAGDDALGVWGWAGRSNPMSDLLRGLGIIWPTLDGAGSGAVAGATDDD